MTTSAKAQTTQAVSIDQFLKAFFSGEDEPVNLRAFYTKDDPQAKPGENGKTDSGRKLHVMRGSLTEGSNIHRTLKELNKQRGLYFVVNSGGDKDEDINRYNAVFMENDRKTIEEQHTALDAAPLPPSIRVETKKSVHAYWLLKGDCEEEQWREVQRRLIHYFNGDPNIKNPSRVMRLPGFDHLTYTGANGHGEPGFDRKIVEVIQFNPERRYTIDELLEASPPAPEEETKKPPQGNKGADPSVKKLPLTLDDIAYDKANPLKRRIANMIVKMSQLPSAHSVNGNINSRGVCHNGRGDSGLWCDPAEVVIFCSNKQDSVKPCNLDTIEEGLNKALGYESNGAVSYYTTPGGLIRLKKVKVKGGEEIEEVALSNFISTITGVLPTM